MELLLSWTVVIPESDVLHAKDAVKVGESNREARSGTNQIGGRVVASPALARRSSDTLPSSPHTTPTQFAHILDSASRQLCSAELPLPPSDANFSNMRASSTPPLTSVRAAGGVSFPHDSVLHCAAVSRSRITRRCGRLPRIIHCNRWLHP